VTAREPAAPPDSEERPDYFALLRDRYDLTAVPFTDREKRSTSASPNDGRGWTTWKATTVPAGRSCAICVPPTATAGRFPSP